MATRKEVKFVPKKDKRVSKYEAVLQTLLKKGKATYPMAKKVEPRVAAHRLYISLYALLVRRTGKAPKLSVRQGENGILGVELARGPK
jgi:hypothetical protein